MKLRATPQSSLAMPAFARIRRCVASASAAVAVAAVPVHAADAVDKMNGVGMPLLFLAMLLCILLTTRKRLTAAFIASDADRAMRICFYAALANMALSVFLFFTTAFNYGLVSTVLAYCVAFLTSAGSLESHAKWFLSVYMMWFFFVLGFPTGWGAGIIRATNSGDCVAFYGTYASTMCVDGWLTFVKVVACLLISLTMLSLLLLIASVAGIGGELLRAAASDGDNVRSALDVDFMREQARPTVYHRI
ncbi:uncharacterized protein Tco025E_04170 [Trypanosoma conorhini]|uniref:Uncharacterized protein n=1 Tax=Trypanosoma conorhini TaxID=83891 RepID=A0A3R7S1T3_9TRYP|nr:uncharacterized protein Tco025E_04170 [Trypanosoma conorhini]RNF19359.1 hypothetical protein Tco025E_04170 [Trypanosoma conorhini]